MKATSRRCRRRRRPAARTDPPARLLLAVAAGYRGLAFWSDRYLANNRQGRYRLLALARSTRNFRGSNRSSPRRPIRRRNGSPRPEGSGVRRSFCARKERWCCPSGWDPARNSCRPGGGGRGRPTVPVAVTSTAWEVTPGRIQSYPIKRVQGGCECGSADFSLIRGAAVRRPISGHALAW